mmetsp:Transcript_11787/g.14247  ORF Transcript_11787/g.14247 Transcript_11787/m.14247 type:complete len:954 (+) Transcript_11787:9-2870(+)
MVVLWDNLPPASDEAPLYGASACQFADSVYVLGGFSQDPGAPAHEIRHCVYDMNTESWIPQEALDVDGEVPSPRAGCSATRIRSSIYLFGGQQLWPSELLDDFYVGSIIQPGVVSWNDINTPSENDGASRRPSISHSESGSATGYATGDGNESLDDETSIRSGEEVTEGAPIVHKTKYPLKKMSHPPPRAWHASCTLENEHGMSVVVICGGISGEKEGGGLCEDMWSFDPEGGTWTNHTPPRKRRSKKPAVGRTPLPRAYHTLTRVGKGTEAVMFGGRTLLGDNSNDIFVLSSLTWTWSQLAPPTPPTPKLPKGDSFSVASGNSLDIGSQNSFDFHSLRSFVPITGPACTSWHSAVSTLIPVEVLELGYSEEELENIAFHDLGDSDDDDDNSHHPSVGGNSLKSVDLKGVSAKPKKLWRQSKACDPTKVEVLLVFGGMSEPPQENDNASVASGASSIAPSTVVPVPPGAPLYALDRQSRWHLINTLDCRKEAGPKPITGGPLARCGSIMVSSDNQDNVMLIGGSSRPTGGTDNSVGGTGLAAALAMKSNRNMSGKKMERFGDAMMLRLFGTPPKANAGDQDLNIPIRTTKTRKGHKKKGPQVVKLNLDDGGTYEGYVDAKGVKSGKGKRVYGPSSPDSGDVYEGDFEDDVREGEGKCTFSDGRVYNGTWVNDEPSGQGIITYPLTKDSGCRAPIAYTGSWRRGLQHGRGVLTLRDGAEIDSIWKNGKMKPDNHTKLITFRTDPSNQEKVRHAITTNCVFDDKENIISGTETFVTESGGGQEEYIGKFNFKGERHGELGVCVYADGSVYRGNWRNGRRNGRGTMEDSRTKELYDGKWVGGERLGKGLCTYPAGHRYDGTWAKGKPDGVGTFFKANGESYHGDFKGGLRHGYGVRTDARGRVMKGWWKNDALVEEDIREEAPRTFDDDDLTSLGAPSVSSFTSYDFNADIVIASE